MRNKVAGISHAADFAAVIQDVLAAHVYQTYCGRTVGIQQSLRSQFFEQQNPDGSNTELMDAVMDFNETSYTQISGGNDVLVVLAAIQYCDAQEQMIKLRLKVYNTCGFKVPYFAIQVLLAADQVLGACTDTALFTAEELHPQEAMGPAAMLFVGNLAGLSTSNDLLGGEYLPSGAMVERELAIKLLYFAPVEIIVRIIYPDLSCDNTFLGAGETNEEDAGQVVKGPRYAAASIQQRSSAQFLTHFGAHVSLAQAGSKWDALLHCAPLYVPLSAMLQPYGGGAFSMYKRCVLLGRVQSQRESECSQPGIPWSVFHAQYLRLGSRHARTVSVLGYDLRQGKSEKKVGMLAQVLDCICESISTAGGLGMHFLGTDCVSVMDSQHSLATGNGLLFLYEPAELDGGKKTQSRLVLGWSLQTLWGGELAIALLEDTLTTSKQDINGALLWGQLHIRCSESHLLTALLRCLEPFVQALSGGYLLPADGNLVATM
jgi:hypothetical protein